MPAIVRAADPAKARKRTPIRDQRSGEPTLGAPQAVSHTALMQVALQRGAYLAQGVSHRGDTKPR